MQVQKQIIPGHLTDPHLVARCGWPRKPASLLKPALAHLRRGGVHLGLS